MEKYLLDPSINIQVHTLGPARWWTGSHLSADLLQLDFHSSFAIVTLQQKQGPFKLNWAWCYRLFAFLHATVSSDDSPSSMPAFPCGSLPPPFSVLFLWLQQPWTGGSQAPDPVSKCPLDSHSNSRWLQSWEPLGNQCAKLYCKVGFDELAAFDTDKIALRTGGINYIYPTVSINDLTVHFPHPSL